MTTSRPDKPDATSSAASLLESQIANEEAERRKERFFWIFAITTMINAGVVLVNDSLAVILIFLMSIVFLMGMANWLEVPLVVRNLERLLNAAEKKILGKKDNMEESE